ncbi:MAG: transcriptional repressor [Actinobacteria bacterium]|nr:MAG: transcriptional repressor [Actinomycetota bacterium]
MSGHDRVEHAAYGRGRLTSARRVIARVAASLPGAFTVDELADAARSVDPGAAATATVYRAVAAMEAAGFVERVGMRDGATLFVRCGDEDHHHHVVCDGCGRIAHAECPLPAITAPEGFVVTRHEVTLYGLCPACAVDGSGS